MKLDNILIIGAMLLLLLSPAHAENPADYPELSGLPEEDIPDVSIRREDPKSVVENPSVTAALKDVRKAWDVSNGDVDGKDEAEDTKKKKAFGSLVTHNVGITHPKDIKSNIGYSSIAEALLDLSKQPNVSFKMERGWLVANQQVGDDLFIWSFTPESHPVYPAIARRRLYKKNGIYYIDTVVSCQNASQVACDRFLAEFDQKNQKILDQMKNLDGAKIAGRKEPYTGPRVKVCRPGFLECDEITKK
ncbi:MAG TPA: hypothetical protein VFX02_00440 [Gammaproteobacteria bacterium]|nr:hypothetical protein [Gammaproteobacteria bacterium]